MNVSEISSKDLENFENNGFVYFKSFMDLDLINIAISRFKHIFKGDFETGVRPDKIKWREDKNDLTEPRSMCNIWKSDVSIARITLNQKIGEFASKLMNWPGARANQDNIFWVPLLILGRLDHSNFEIIRLSKDIKIDFEKKIKKNISYIFFL